MPAPCDTRQTDLQFDGPARKERGLDTVEANHTDWIRRAQAEAVRIANERGTVHIDDIRDWAEATGEKPASSRAWGVVFRRSAERPWRAVGLRASRHPSNHAHASPVWTLEAP